MQRFLTIFLLECYACALVALQSLGHVRTDEAKYLLNIPYPHPPLVRFILSLTDGWIFQEIFWRLVFATLVIQAVWIVWSMGVQLARRERLILCGLWLVCGAVLFQAGSIMMAPLTALEGLLFCWMAARCDLRPGRIAGWSAVLWLVSLFTAYQGVLYLPILIFILHRARLSWISVCLIIGIPLGLLSLYTLSNPLALASLLNAGTDNTAMPLGRIVGDFLSTWAIAGSIALTVAGLYGMIVTRAWIFLITFVLVSLYTVASVHLYYALLFTPLLLAGCVPLFVKYPGSSRPLLILTLLGSCLLWPMFHPVFTPDPTRALVQALHLIPTKGDLMINGSFGHDWQYESPVPVRIFSLDALSEAQAVVCLKMCPPGVANSGEWSRIQDAQTEVYIKQ